MVAPEKPTVAGFDPLLHEIDLPLHATHYPLGFRLNLATNSRHVLEAAEEAWSIYTSEFDRQPIDLRFIVQPEGNLADEQPVFRGQREQYSIVFDRHNFGVYDANSMTGFCFVSQKTAASHLRLRMHFLESITYALLALRHAMPLHAAAIGKGGSGFLLCGPSGAGKSTLSYACARAGWTFISDDATWLPADVDGRTAIGRPHQARFREDAPRLFPELEGYAAQQRPNGKLTIEAPTAELSVSTALRCEVDHLVMLDRHPGRARICPISAHEVVESILADSPSYGDRVRLLYERTLARLLTVRAWRLEYETVADALNLLSEI